MIDHLSFDTETMDFYNTGEWPGLSDEVKPRALKLLDKLDAAIAWNDVRRPPGSRLEKIHGTCPARFALHVRDEYWLTFKWEEPFCMALRLEKLSW
jgi:plasmid maintenance system killer protein